MDCHHCTSFVLTCQGGMPLMQSPFGVAHRASWSQHDSDMQHFQPRPNFNFIRWPYYSDNQCTVSGHGDQGRYATRKCVFMRCGCRPTTWVAAYDSCVYMCVTGSVDETLSTSRQNGTIFCTHIIDKSFFFHESGCIISVERCSWYTHIKSTPLLCPQPHFQIVFEYTWTRITLQRSVCVTCQGHVQVQKSGRTSNTWLASVFHYLCLCMHQYNKYGGLCTRRTVRLLWWALWRIRACRW